MSTINPVQIVSDFLKSAEGKDLMATLKKTERCLEVGAVDGISIILGKDGFKARTNGREEPAVAYDVFDAVMAGETTFEGNNAEEVFLRVLYDRIAARPA